jgi:hypothetical protein
MARKGSRVQLEHSDMRLAWNMAKMTKDAFSCAAMEELKYLIKTPRTKVREEKKRSVEFPGHKKVKDAIQRDPAMHRQNQTSGFLPCQNGTAQNPQTRWRRKGPGAPPSVRWKERTPEPTPPLPGTPPAPTGNTSGAQPSQIVSLPARYTYSHTLLPCLAFSKGDEDTQNNTHFDPDMLIDQG